MRITRRVLKAPKRERSKRVHVRGYCRRKGTVRASWERAGNKAKEWGF